MKYIIVTVVLFTCFVFLHADDSIPTYLNELIVESKHSWIENDRVVFVPTKREKNLADSPETLISSMNIPFIKVKNGSISDLRGESVSVFVNGIELTDVELSTFIPKDVTRVEYFSNPADPKFKGKRAVVNFVTPVYIAGGITKLSANQSLPNYRGRYDVSSKLIFKKMTYVMMVEGVNFRSNNNSKKEESYSHLWYENKYYNTIHNNSEDTVQYSNCNLNAVFNAIYQNDRIRLLHSVGIYWNKVPNDKNVSTNNWNPNIFGSSSAWSINSSNSISPHIAGRYTFNLSSKFDLHTNWNYSYASNHNHSENSTGLTPVIYNNSSEVIHSIGILAIASYRFNPKSYLQFQFVDNTNFYSIHYKGTYNEYSRQAFGNATLGLRWFWQPTNNIFIDLTPGVSLSYRDINNVMRDSSVKPNVYYSIQWYQTSRSYLNIYGNFNTDQNPASMVNEVTIRESELIWLKGNPNLNNNSSFHTGIQQSWLCAPWLTSIFNLSYLNWKSRYLNYYAAPKEMEGMITQYINDKPYHQLDLSVNINSSILSRKLYLDVTPAWTMMCCENEKDSKILNRFNINGRIRYNVKNFSFGISYNGAEKTIGDGGTLMTWKPDKWGLEVSYGNGNLYASFSVDDIFHSKSIRRWNYVFDDYSNYQAVYQTGRRFNLRVSYAFGYGKKVDANIDVQRLSAPQSGVLGVN